MLAHPLAKPVTLLAFTAEHNYTPDVPF